MSAPLGPTAPTSDRRSPRLDRAGHGIALWPVVFVFGTSMAAVIVPVVLASVNPTGPVASALGTVLGAAAAMVTAASVATAAIYASLTLGRDGRHDPEHPH